jgi:hypothetical protein
VRRFFANAPSSQRKSCVSRPNRGAIIQRMAKTSPLDPKDEFGKTLELVKDTIDNRSENHHGIEQYLIDPDVARWIHSELTK